MVIILAVAVTVAERHIYIQLNAVCCCPLILLITSLCDFLTKQKYNFS